MATLETALPALDDPEGARVPEGLPAVVDAHVHLFPARLHAAIADWFDRHGWRVRYRLDAPGVIDFLRTRGVAHQVALHYAHKPGLARALNGFVAELQAAHRDVTGLATVLPGEPGALDILREAEALGLRGLKLHCHVQCFAPDAAAMAEIYDFCSARGWPLVLHAGREPNSPAYQCDVAALCGVERVAAVLRRWPALRLCVPHLGFDEVDEYAALLETHDNLWLDTTMVAAEYFPPVWRQHTPLSVIRLRPERVMYGTDFPNLPYSWDRELRLLAALPLTAGERGALFGGTAREFFRLAPR